EAATATTPTRKPATTSKKKPAVKPATAKKPVKKPATKTTTKSATTKSSVDAASQKALIGELAMLREVWLRKITLEYLGEKRSEEFLASLLVDFPKKLQRNFVENIKGDYKAEFMANYAAKADEVTDKAFAVMTDKPALDGLLGKVIKESGFPLDLAYTDLVKKLVDRRKFQANNKEAGADKLSEFWQAVYTTMKANAKKSRYEAVAEIYKDVPLKEFPISWYDDAQHNVAFETEGAQPAPTGPQGRKPWTVLAYICADNDLERFGLQDVNEMEQIGSSDKVNIIAQLDRMRQGMEDDTITDGNWTGTRRYYVTKDDDMGKIGSQMVGNLGEQSMGDKKTLAEFIKWGVQTYPADNVMVVIWNHGAGWIGVALDQEDNKMLSMTDVSWALREGQKELSKVNGKASKFAIVDFDACLMGTIEVAYELSDCAQFLVASEENEPGQGMPYADYLGPLVKNPALAPREMTKRMVGTYVYSYAKGGSATNQFIMGSPVTKSATDLGKLPALVKKFDALGRALLDNHQLYADLLVAEGGRFASIKRYSDETMVDLVDFAHKLAQVPEIPTNIREICIDIIKSIGYPVENSKLAQPVIITSEQPGVVIWGYNDWRMPPKELWPSGTRVFNSRLAMTPLRELDGGGFYVKIGPFAPVKDEALEKIVFVEEINYQVVLKDGKELDKRRIKQGKEHLIVSKFPETSPMVIEGHTQGMGDSHGLSLYFPQAYRFNNTYKALKFSKDTVWDEFLEKIPVFKRDADVLLCGQMVEDMMTLPLIAQALKANDVKFQILWDPSVFAYEFKPILRQFADKGMVITDSVSASSMGQLAPSSDDLLDYLSNGGRLMVAAQSFGKSNVHRSLLKDYFKFTFVEEEKDFDEMICKGKSDFKFELNGSESAKTAENVTIMKVGSNGQLFATMPDGRGAAIYVSDKAASGKTYAGLYLGFRFEAVGDTAARNQLMGAILDKLLPERHQLSLF
ncbi:MAG: peptidase C11 clostripain, partial [uncultured bacterium]